MGKVGEIFIVLDTKLDRFNKGMSDAERAMVRVGTKFTAIGKNLTKFVTLPLLAIGVVAVKAFADFDKAMTESLAIMGPISDSMKEKMASVAKTISEETIFSANKLAESYYFLASAGMTAEQSIAALDKVALFAQAGAFDLATATDLLTDAQTAMGLSSKDAAVNQANLVKVSDVLVGANTLANASVEQFSKSLTNMAAAALTNANKGLEEGVAILAAFADKGIKGQKAGMKLSMMLNALDKAASKNKEAWKKYNVQLWDAEGNMRNVGDIIGDLETAFKHLTPEAKAAAMAELGFDVRVKNSILSLMGSSEKILQWTEDLKKMGGITEEVAEKQMASFSNQLKVVKNMLVNVGAEIGEILVPVLKNLIENHIKPAIEWFKKLTDGQKETIVKVAGLAAAFGPLLIVFGKLLIVIPKIGRSLKLLAASPMGLIITGLVIIAEKTRQAINTFKKFSESLDTYLTASGEKMNWFAKTWNGVTAAIHKHVYGVDAAKVATKFYTDEVDRLNKKQVESLKDTLDAIKKTDSYKGAVDSLKSAFGFLIPKIKETSAKTKDLTGDTKNLGTAIKTTSEVIENDFGRAGRDMTDVLDWINSSIPTTTIPAFRDLSGVLYNVQGSFEDLTIEERNFLEESKKVTKGVKSAWDTLADGLQTKWASMISGILTETGTLKEKLSSMFGAVKTQFADMAGEALSKWMTTTAGMKAGAAAFALYVSVNVVSQVLKAFGIIKENWADVLAELEKAREIPDTEKGTKRRLEDMAEDTHEWTAAMADLDKQFRLFNKTGEMTLQQQKLLDDAWASAISMAIKYGYEGSKAFIDQIKHMREMGLESKALSEYIWGQLSKIPDALGVIINNIPDFLKFKERLAEKKIKLKDVVDPELRAELIKEIDILEQRMASGIELAGERLDRAAKITEVSWLAMIAEGKGYMEVLDAMKEPLETLRQRYKDLGQDVPVFLAPMFETLEKMKLFPKIFENLDASSTILESLTNSAYLTQGAFNALTSSATSFAKTILGAKGNLNDFMDTAELTQSQKDQLMPTVSQFVGSAAAFDLKVPKWMKTFIEEQQGLDWKEFKAKAAAQANAGIETVKELDKIDKKIHHQTEVIKNKFDALGGKIYNHFSTVTERVTGRLDELQRIFKNIKFGASGLSTTVAQPTLFMAGEVATEHVNITPVSEGSKSSQNIQVANNVILNGTIITDREYTRNRMMPEILSALEANFEKSKMKQLLGIE